MDKQRHQKLACHIQTPVYAHTYLVLHKYAPMGCHIAASNAKQIRLKGITAIQSPVESITDESHWYREHA